MPYATNLPPIRSKKKSAYLFFPDKGKYLREYIQCFNTKRLELGNCSNNVAMDAFTADLKKRENKNLVR